jgi:hypothetical protein
MPWRRGGGDAVSQRGFQAGARGIARVGGVDAVDVGGACRRRADGAAMAEALEGGRRERVSGWGARARGSAWVGSSPTPLAAAGQPRVSATP